MRKLPLVALLALLASCSPLELRSQDAVSRSLLRHVDGPVLAMAHRFGPPAHKTDKSGRWYFWNLGDTRCTVSARVDGQDVVVDAYWSGDREACEKVMSETAYY